MQQSIRRRWQSGWLIMTLVLLMAISPLPVYASVIPGTAPAECLTDQGQAITPTVTGAWVLVLNFNHAPALTTTGCVIYLTPGDKLEYTMIECQLPNNLRGGMVGGGAATFDGQFWIECPDPYPGASILTNFYVRAQAQFAALGSYTLLDHKNILINATVGGDWEVGLASSYGHSYFSHVDWQSNVQGQQVALLSEVRDQVGIHGVNGQSLLPAAKVDPFSFDTAHTITIGGPGQVWTLLEAIIDPAGRCCR